MKKRVWKGKRLFSLLLAFVMLASIMPLELLVGAISPREEPADISVVMSAEPEKVGLSGFSTVTLAVTLADKIDYATIHIELDKDEINAIQSPFWGNTEGDTDAVLLDESADSAGEVTETTVTRVEDGLEIYTSAPQWTKTFSVSYPRTAPETLVEGEGAPADESEKFEFSVENDDITLKCFEWVPEDVTSPEPESGTEGPLSDNSTGETDSSADVPVTPADETDTPTDVPETPADETDTSADVLVTPTDETETDVLSDPAEQKNPEDEEPEQPGAAPVEGGAVYETVTLAASTGGKENENDDNGNGGGDSRNESGKEPPTTYFKGVTVTFTNQEEEQAPENPEFTLSLSTDSEITPVDRKLPDFTFTATAKLNEDAVVAEGDSISFQLQIQLPEGITFPEGTYFSEVDTKIVIKYTGEGETGGTVAEIPLPDGVEVGDITAKGLVEVSEDLSTLTLSITQAIHPAESSGEPTEPGDSSGAGEPAAPITEWDYTVTVKGEPLTVSESFQEGQITISGMDAEGESLGVVQKISVNAEEIAVPENIQATLDASIKKTIIFQDNYNEDDLRSDQDVFQDLPIYFSKDGGTTWERLTWEDLPGLGMESWPQAVIQ